MALNKEFYASMFAASTRAHAAAPPSAAPAHARPFAAHAKKEFDLTSFLKDLAAVRTRMAMRLAICACDVVRARAMVTRAVRRRGWIG